LEAGLAVPWAVPEPVEGHIGDSVGRDTDAHLVIASPAVPGVAIQLDGLLRRPPSGLLAMTKLPLHTPALPPSLRYGAASRATPLHRGDLIG